jgi:hypothetical protein
MAVELLSQQFVGLKKETVRNTAELTPNLTLKVDSNTVQQKTEFTLEEIIYGDRDNNYDEYANKSFLEGEISGHINSKDIGSFLFFALGQVASTQISTSTAYTHTFTRVKSNTLLPTFTLFYKYGDAGMFKSRGCVIDELSLEIGEEESKFTATIKGIEELEVTDVTGIAAINSAIAYSTPDPKLTFGNLVFTYADSVTALGAVTNNTSGTGTVLNLRPGLKINIKNNVEYDMSSSATPAKYIRPLDTIAQKFEASMEFSGLIRSKTPRTLTVDALPKAFEAMLVNVGAPNVGTSSVKPELRFRVSQATAKTEIDTSLNEALAYSINLDNLINTPAEGTSISVSLINTTTNY